jgi:integrase
MAKQSADQILAAVNSRLRQGCWGVSVQIRGGRLSLRAVLPPAPGSGRTAPYQQQIALHLRANPEGLRAAEAQARLLAARLATDKFSWADYREPGNAAAGVVWYEIERFKSDLLDRQGKALKTWNLGYWRWLRQLPDQSQLTSGLLTRYLDRYPSDSASRFYAATALGAFARFCGLDFDPKHWRGSYSGQTRPAPRNLPSDAQIVEVWQSILEPRWRWVLGMMATYGLRNHEVMRLRGFSGLVLEVGENTKTGSRQVWPCLPEWVDQFGLVDGQPPDLDLDLENVELGHAIGNGLRKRCSIQPYNLRHAWAVRTLLYGWPPELAARQMGHSLAIHSRTYHRWLNADHQQRVFDALVARAGPEAVTPASRRADTLPPRHEPSAEPLSDRAH